MKFGTKGSEFGSEIEGKYECFVCAAKSDQKGLSLMQCQTAFSRITLGEKLQEILGTKYLVLISAKDKVCWDCAMFMNWIDRFEHKIELMKEHFYDKIHAKYKRVEVCLQEESEVPPKAVPQPEPPPVHQPPVKHSHYQEERSRRRKEFACKYCGKEYVSLMSLTLHIQRAHAIVEVCQECGAKFNSKAKLRRHTRDAHPPPGKELACVSCGFHTSNTEVYCRHVCNSSIVSLTCISCNKRYVDSNFRDVKGAYKCQPCLRAEGGDTQKDKEEEELAEEPLPPVEVVEEDLKRQVKGKVERAPQEEDEEEEEEREEDDQEPLDRREREEMEILESSPLPTPQQEEMANSELMQELPEFFKETVISDEIRSKEDHESYLRCEGCRDEFKLRDLTQHPCFIRGDSVEFVEVEAPSNGNKNPENPLLTCKACEYQFSSIEALRNHWDQTGHLREVNSSTVEINRIKDKFKKTEATFKVVKQNFSIRAVIPGQNEEVLRSTDDYKDIFIRVSDNKIDPIEDFVKRSSNCCGTCGVTFPSEAILAKHQSTECLTCVTCGIHFLDNKLLKKHYLYTGHASKLRATESPSIATNTLNSLGYKCHRCAKTFPSRFLLRKHFQVHFKGTDKGACQFCLAEFDNKNDIQQHVLEVHGAHLYKCSYCDRTFMSELFKNRHEAKHKTASAHAECSACNLKFPNQRGLMLHNETYHRGTTCKLCGKVVEDPISLRRHERRHYFEKGLECGVCKKHFRNKALLMAHSKQHSIDEIKYQCEICLLGFLTEESLKEHRLIHSSKNKYKCTHCGMTFASRAHFWTHSKTHNITYPCSVCNRTFRDSSLLAIHRRKHWRVRPYQCPQCPRMFSVSATLLRHLYVHSRHYPHRCGICKKGFLTQHAYHRHTETIHAVSNNFHPPRPNIPSLPLNATDEDIFQAADTLIADDTIMFNEFPNKEMEQSSSSDLITNEVVVETTELFDEILH